MTSVESAALRDRLGTARRELDALGAAVRLSSACAELTAAIARRDAVLSARRDGAFVGVHDLAALEAGVTPTAAVRQSITPADGAEAAHAYLAGLAIGLADPGTTGLPAGMLHRMLRRLSGNAPADDLHGRIDAIVAEVAADREVDHAPTSRVAAAAGLYRGLSSLGESAASGVPALARIASGLLLRTAGSPLEPVVAPQIRARMGHRWRESGTAAAGDVTNRWLERFALDVATTARRTRGLVAQLSALDERDRRRIESLGKAAPSCHRVHRVLERWPVASIDLIKEATGLRVQTATSALHRLRGLGIVREMTRRHRHRVYIYEFYIAIIADDIASWSTEPEIEWSDGAS
jgi:hypothetical protein